MNVKLIVLFPGFEKGRATNACIQGPDVLSFYIAHSGVVPAVANAGPDCGPCGGPLKVLCRAKEGETF
jgi:hypothetical protein